MYTVELAVNARPGQNTLRFLSDIPACTGRPAVDIHSFCYDNFSVQSTAVTADLDIRLPIDWKKTVHKKGIIYFSKRRESEIRIINKGPENVAVTLSFVYRILTDLHTTRNIYREEVQYMDRHFGELIAFLKKKGMYENSFFLVMGECFVDILWIFA